MNILGLSEQHDWQLHVTQGTTSKGRTEKVAFMVQKHNSKIHQNNQRREAFFLKGSNQFRVSPAHFTIPLPYHYENTRDSLKFNQTDFAGGFCFSIDSYDQ